MGAHIPNHGMRIGGETIGTDRAGERCIAVFNPFTEQCIPSVPKATLEEVRRGIGEAIASKAGYKRMVLELGGNDPIIVMDDADLDEASTLAVPGSYKNSGQRCTAVKRLLVHAAVAERFTDLVVETTRAWTFGDPGDASVEMGTVNRRSGGATRSRRSSPSPASTRRSASPTAPLTTCRRRSARTGSTTSPASFRSCTWAR